MTAEVVLRPFGRDDFQRLISWVANEAALVDWCGGFFHWPLDETQLERYLESSRQPNTREVFTACTDTGEPVGHIELSHIWPYLSSRLSRVLVTPRQRRRGHGNAMINRACAHSFERHHVQRIDLGVSTRNEAAIACYRKLGFRDIGVWPAAMQAGGRTIDVNWMTLFRQ